MSIFSYTGSALANLVGNTPGANVSNLVTLLNDIKTFINGANIDETNVPNLSAAFTTYKPVMWGGATASSAQISSANAFLLNAGGTAAGASAVAQVGGAGTGSLAFYLDPARWTANARTTKLAVHAMALAGGTASGVTSTVGIAPVATFGGAAANSATIATVGTVLAGSTVAFTTPAANSQAQSYSGDFNFPTAGWHCFVVTSSGAYAANAFLTLVVSLQLRQV